MYETDDSAEAKRRKINQQSVTDCPGFEGAIYILYTPRTWGHPLPF